MRRRRRRLLYSLAAELLVYEREEWDILLFAFAAGASKRATQHSQQSCSFMRRSPHTNKGHTVSSQVNLERLYDFICAWLSLTQKKEVTRD